MFPRPPEDAEPEQPVPEVEVEAVEAVEAPSWEPQPRSGAGYRHAHGEFQRDDGFRESEVLSWSPYKMPSVSKCSKGDQD